jgi:hypothetical protein
MVKGVNRMIGLASWAPRQREHTIEKRKNGGAILFTLVLYHIFH